MMRAFIAIDLPDQVRAELAVLQSRLAIGRKVPQENFHLTLSFLGEQRDTVMEDVYFALETIGATAFDVRLAGVGCFGAPSPTVVFADCRHSQKLMDLEKKIARTLGRAGVDFQKRRFHPHVTLARLPKTLPTPDMALVQDFVAQNATFQGSEFRVRRFTLYQSVLTPKTAVHEPLASFELMDPQ